MNDPTRPGAPPAHIDWVTGQPATCWRLYPAGTPLTIALPGNVAVRIDPAGRVLAIDGRNSLPGDEGVPSLPGWVIRDLRDGVYGGFHRLRPAGECFDPRGCADEGMHELSATAPAAMPESPALTPAGYFASISFFGHIEHTGYVTEVTGHGGIPAYHVDLPDKVWGGDPFAEVEYAASAYFGHQVLSEDSVRSAWVAERERAERVKREQAEWVRRAAERSLPPGAGAGLIVHADGCEDAWCPGDCAAPQPSGSLPQQQGNDPDHRREGHMEDDTSPGAQEGAEGQPGDAQDDGAGTDAAQAEDGAQDGDQAEAGDTRAE